MARSPELERRVLDALWQGGDWSVRDVLEAVDTSLAYTTFATVLDRLHAKAASTMPPSLGPARSAHPANISKSSQAM